MNAKNFNDFYEFLKDNRELAEYQGWAFMQMTAKQICKIIDYYYIIGELTLTEFSLKFGKVIYPLSEYEKHTGFTFCKYFYSDTGYYIVKKRAYK